MALSDIVVALRGIALAFALNRNGHFCNARDDGEVFGDHGFRDFCMRMRFWEICIASVPVSASVDGARGGQFVAANRRKRQYT